MNVTGTGVAIGTAVVVALAFLFFGPSILRPFSAQPTTQPMTDQTATADAAQPAEQAPDPTTLQVNDTKVGTGAIAAAGDTITVNYVGALTDGTVFDASEKHGQPFSFTLGAGQVIQGWDQGIVGMKEGGERILVIPASMGYGAHATGPIPANSALIFKVDLVKVQKGSK